MEKSKLNVKLIVGVVIASLLLVVVGQFAYYKLYLNAPLAEELKKVPGISKVKIEDNNGQSTVEITLKKIDNLQNSYVEINKIVTEKAGKNMQINIQDKTNNFLENVYRQMNFSIQEAIVQGNFADMYIRLGEIAKENKIKDWNLYIDKDNIYLQIMDKDDYLYRVVPRGSEKINVEGN